jgi:YVTN family beta-propeller protein
MRKAGGIVLLMWFAPAWAIGAANYSSHIILSPDDRFVWVANPDNNSVTVINVGGDLDVKVAEILVGAEPQCVAITPDGLKVYVTNMGSGTVSVINAVTGQVFRVIPVGTEPFGCALTPDGTKLYVANFSSDTVSVINTVTDTLARTIALPASNPKPRGVASTASGKVYVTSFLAKLADDGRPVDQQEGRDDGKVGHVTVISSATDTVLGTVVLSPLADTGFRSNGSVLDRIPATDPATFTSLTGAFPNLLQGIGVKGNKVYIPNTGSSPNGPFRFNVNVQGLISVIDTTNDSEFGQSLNMNRGIPFEPTGQRLFNTNPIAIAFKNNSNEGYAALGATDRLIRVVLDANGTPSVNAPTAPVTNTPVVRISVGKNPRGIVINSTDSRAYVMNLISRDVSVVDIADGSPTKNLEIARIASAPLPPPGTLAAAVQHGHELFVTALGPPGDGSSAPPGGRMSDTGWGACYSCHPSGLTDGVTWMFPDGPRQSISMESTAQHPQPLSAMLNPNGAPLLPSFHQRVLNWSAVRDEVQDFELNIRAVSGGQGLIRDGQAVVNLVPTANTGRDSDLDAIAAYISFGIRAPISPLRPRNVFGAQPDPEIPQGRALFLAANCQLCHGGPNWTRSRVDFQPPPLAETITGGQLRRFLFQVGTFDPAAFNEVRGAGTAIVPANGSLGFNIPSLISVFASAPYFHNGSAPTLDDVLANVTHRSSGTGGVDTLSSAADRAKLVKFLRSIDARTPAFP